MTRKVRLAPKTLRRFQRHETIGRVSRLPEDHPAVVTGHTKYPSRVTQPGPDEFILKSGKNNHKIGARVARGRWAGMEIYTLTLEERATCPTSCRHWRDCYGGKMHWPKRWAHGAALEEELDFELRELAEHHPQGYVVRLHILGDFYSVAYVERWLKWLDEIPQLHVWGYTSWPAGSPIGDQLRRASKAHWERFAIRTSNSGEGARSTETLYPKEHLDRTLDHLQLAQPSHKNGILCPAQQDKTECCATCALCWETQRPILFQAH